MKTKSIRLTSNVAYYDPETDTIHNCQYGSYAWHHESRHRKQYRTWFKGRLKQMEQGLYYLTYYSAMILLLFVFIFKELTFFFLGAVWLPYTLLHLILEVDAHVNGFLDWRKEKRQS